MKLFFREAGDGSPIIMLHGIFGSSDNWLTPARFLSSRFKTYAVDLRNHGQSGHDDEFDYEVMVEDVRSFLDEQAIQKPVLIGHSMGGKVAMNFAVKYPELLSCLVVVDIAPKAYSMKPYPVLDGLNAIDISHVRSRSEADASLEPHVAEPDVRQFLLKNLQRKSNGGFQWKLNLDSINANIEKIGLGLLYSGKFEKPTLFVRGLRSNYIRDTDINQIRQVFTNAEIKSLDTGHWLPAEKPKEFADLVMKWLEEKSALEQ